MLLIGTSLIIFCGRNIDGKYSSDFVKIDYCDDQYFEFKSGEIAIIYKSTGVSAYKSEAVGVYSENEGGHYVVKLNLYLKPFVVKPSLFGLIISNDELKNLGMQNSLTGIKFTRRVF
jgi:hypothetical protein